MKTKKKKKYNVLASLERGFYSYLAVEYYALALKLAKDVKRLRKKLRESKG